MGTDPEPDIPKEGPYYQASEGSWTGRRTPVVWAVVLIGFYLSVAVFLQRVVGVRVGTGIGLLLAGLCVFDYLVILYIRRLERRFRERMKRENSEGR